MSSRMPVTRTLVIVDKVLSFLILVLGLIIAYLAITTGNLTMGLASLIFLSVGFVKLRKVIPGMFRAIQKPGVVEQVAYKNVLLPVARPEAAESIIKLASEVLGPGGKLIIVNVIVLPPQLSTEAEVKKDSARTLLKDAIGFANRMDVDAKAEIVTARTAAEAILDRAREFKCDLIIMGSSQRTVTEKMLFGDVADVVLRHAPCDVMVLSYTNAQHPVNYDKILVPTAGYRHSTRALDIAVDIAKKSHGKITTLYVGSEADAVKGNRILADATQRTEQKGVRSEAKFTTGNVEDAILGAARGGGYSLIIIGATEHPKYYTALVGNIADNVVKRSPCDVLVVRTKA
jgi:nucleotide-binding universal stress UspA family protein